MKIRRAIFWSVLSGILFVLSLPHFNFWSLSWFALVPLLIVIQKIDRIKLVFLFGLITGAIYFLGMTYWIIPLYPFANLFWTILGAISLALYSALYVALFALLMKKIKWQSGLLYIFSASVFWTGLEWIRSWLFTGFPWGHIGYAQWKDLPFIQISSITGVYGISFLVIMVNATIAYFILKRSEWRATIKTLLLPACIFVFIFVYGFVVMSQDTKEQEKVKVLLVPGNIRQIDKWHRKNLPWIFAKYLKTTIEAVDEPIDLIIWPETAIPTNFFSIGRLDYLQKLNILVEELNTNLFLGMPYYNEQGEYYNAAFLISSEGTVLDSYYKIHLVPISESIPFKEYIPEQIREKIVGLADFESGEKMTIFRLPNKDIAFGSVICFESAFPNLFRKFVKKGALFMGVITNDAWFQGTGCAEQHYAMAMFRAIENRVSLFHCANGGISCIIDKYGRESTDKIIGFEKNSDGFIKGTLTVRNNTTIYSRFGDWFAIFCCILLVGFAIKLGYDYYQQRKKIA